MKEEYKDEEVIEYFEEEKDNNNEVESSSGIETIEAEEIPGTGRDFQSGQGFQQVFQFSGDGNGFFSVFSSGGPGNIKININGQGIDLSEEYGKVEDEHSETSIDKCEKLGGESCESTNFLDDEGKS